MIEQRKESDYTITSISGKLMGGPETAEFNKYISNLRNNGTVNLILDLGGLRWINAAGIGALIAGITSFKNNNRTVRLVNLSPKVKDVFTITNLSAVLEIYDSVEDTRK